jgi:hypothetical protein
MLSPERSPLHSVPTASGGPRITVVISEIEGHLLGINMAWVSAIEEHAARPPGEAEGSEERQLDIVDLWRLPDPASARGERRVVAIETPTGRCRLVVGRKATVQRLAVDALQPLPAFLEEVGRRSAVAAFFVDGPRVGFLLEVDGLDRWSREGSREGGQ